MKTQRSALRIATAIGVAALAAACGGGGGSSGSPGPTPGPSGGPPASGVYALDLTAQGSTATPKFGLSLIHPSAPDIEYVVEPSSSAVSDATVVSSGAVDAPHAKVSAIQPYAAVYIVGGDVRRVSLIANGAAPLSRLQKAGSTDACRFVVQANDFASPDQSRYIVSTAGADNMCGTADDGQAEVQLNASGGLSYTPLGGARRLAVIRNPATLAPRGWITTHSVLYWSAGEIPTRTLTPLDSVVIDTYQSAVVASGGGLGIIDFSATGPAGVFTEKPLDPALTAGTGWQSIGYDAGHYYLYRNSSSTPTASTWSVLSVDRATAAVTQLASGSELLASASMGVNLLYATESSVTLNRLLGISKTLPGPAQVIESSPPAMIASVATSANGAHELWRRPSSGSAGFAIEIINESGVKLLTAAGGYPLSQPDPTAQDFNTSESHTQFIFASGYGAAAFSGATLQTYDATAGTSTIVGALPGASRYGTDPAFVGVTGTSLPFMAGYAGRVIGGNLQSTDAVVFSFDVRTPGSLRIATTKQ